MSKNHQYLDLQGNGIYARYQKTQIAEIVLIRPNPYKLSERVYAILSTPEDRILYRTEKDADGDPFVVFDGRKELDYDTEVLETYAEDEDRLFRRLNEKLFRDGLLVEYVETRTEPTFENALTDVEVLDLAKIRLPNVLAGKLKSITSQHTLERIRDQAIALGRPKNTLKVIDERIEYVTNGIAS